MTELTEKNKTVVKCKNCGYSCTSNFCPDCGQSTKEKRLENKTFFIGLLSGLSRINQGFIYTAWHLLIHPWTVIRDYIQCRRVRYVPPVSMLIVVCFLSAFISGLMPSEPPGEIVDIGTEQIPFTYKIVLVIMDFIMDSMIVRNLTIYIPALLAIPIVYSGVGARKYNVAEYFTAMIYMTSAFLLFGIVTSPLSLLSESWYSRLEIAYSIFICSMAMYKAFPIQSLKNRIGFFLLYILVSALLYMIIMIGVAALLGFGKDLI